MFTGFSETTFAFLRGISAHNDKAWFEDHRADYETHYVGAGKAFVETIGPLLRHISPEVQFEAKINGSISRINRDVRFSKDKSPYKDHLDIWFWHGAKRGWECPGFYVQVKAETVFVAVGMYGFPKDMLKRYQQLVSNPAKAEEIKAILDSLAASGPYETGGRNRKSPPRGLPAEGASGEMLLYDSLGVSLEWDASVARDTGFIDFCLGHWHKCWPVGKWTLDNLWR